MDRRRRRSHSEPTTPERAEGYESYSEAHTETRFEYGAVGGQQVVRHEHHHHHEHHHYHHNHHNPRTERQRVPTTYERQSWQDVESLNIHALRLRDEATPSVPVAPTPASGAIPKAHRAVVPIPDSPESYRRISPILSASSSPSRRRASRSRSASFTDSVYSPRAISFGSEESVPRVYTFSSSPSPTVSVLELSHGEEPELRSDFFKYSRVDVKILFLEAIYNLQPREWKSTDEAWDALVRKLFGSGWAAIREAEVAFEFAFWAAPSIIFDQVFKDRAGTKAQLKLARQGRQHLL